MPKYHYFDTILDKTARDRKVTAPFIFFLMPKPCAIPGVAQSFPSKEVKPLYLQIRARGGCAGRMKWCEMGEMRLQDVLPEASRYVRASCYP